MPTARLHSERTDLVSIVHMDSESEIRNVKFNFFTATWVEMNGDRGKIQNVLAPSFNHNAPAIVVAGADCDVEEVYVAANDGGLACIEVTGDRAYLRNIRSDQSNDAAAVRFNGSDDSILDGLDSNLDEQGLIILDSARVTAVNVRVTASDDEGILLDGATNCVLEATVYQAGQHGIRVLDSDRNRLSGQVIDAGKDTNNTYDGVFIEGDSDRNRTEFTVTYPGAGNRMRYGLNISAATVDNHVEASILDGTGATANFNDAGTGTVLTDDHLV